MVKKAAQATPNRLLRAARKEHGWTQQLVADRIGAPLALNISRWESGTAFPSAYYIERLCQLFGKSVRELGLSKLDDETQDEHSSAPVQREQMLSPSIQEAWQEGMMPHGPLVSTSGHHPVQYGQWVDLLTFRDDTLPLQLTPLVGREAEVKSVCAMLRQPEVRLVTLTGTGGIGKTRLALSVATELRADFDDGVYFVSLAVLDDSAFVVSTIAQTLGLKETEHRSLLALMQIALRDKRLLLLLDNFERLLPAAPQLTNLLSHCPQLSILVTSRAVLCIQGEYKFPVPPLALPELESIGAPDALVQHSSVALFVQRAQAVKPGFGLRDSNARAIAEICVRLDGLPLSLELAAARCKVLSPQELLGRLSHRLEVLTSGPQDLPERQRTLRNTILWSYQLLDAQEQRLFRQLSVFVGGCTLQAVEVVSTALDGSESAGRILENVTSLLDKSLLQVIQQEGKESRLVMLETIREYGLEALMVGGELEVMREAHANYYLQVAEEEGRELGGLQATVALERLEGELDNLRAVMRWSLEREEMGYSIELALRLGAALWQLWRVRGLFSEGRIFLEQALIKSKGIEAPYRVKALMAAASLADSQDDADRAEALCEESLTLCREMGDTRGIAVSLRLLWTIAHRRNKLAEAYSLTEEALALFREVGDLDGIAWSLADSAHRVSHQGEYARGMALHEEALELWREVGHKDRIAQSNVCLAEMLFDSQGDLARVHALLEEGLTLSRELGYKRGIACGTALSGRIALRSGDSASARSLMEESLVHCREMGNREDIATALFVLGRVAESQSDYEAARALFKESLAIARVASDNRHIASCLEGLADLCLSLGEHVEAVRLWGIAEALREELGTPIAPIYRAGYECSVATARAQLGEKAFAIVLAEGRMLTLEQGLTVGEPASISAPAKEGDPQYQKQ